MAADKAWNGASNTTWNTGANWVGSSAPGASDNAVFNSTFSNQPNLTGNTTVGGIWMTGSVGQNVTISGGSNILTLNGNTINGTAGLGILIDNANAFTFTINCGLKVGNAQSWTNNSSNLFTVGGAVDANHKALTINGSGNTSISGVLSNSGAITKAGSGTLTLSNTGDSYTSQLTVQAGTLQIDIINNASANGELGNNALSVILGNAGGVIGTLEYTGSTASSTKKFTMATGGTGAFQVDTAGTTLTLNGVIDGSGALSKTGAGTMVLSASNTYTGGTTVSAGTLQDSASERLADSGALTVSGGTFDVQTFTETVGTVTLSSGSITGTGAGTVIGSSYAMQSGTVSAILGGAAALTKTTSGTVTLSGANTFTGATTVSAGTLILAASSGSALGSTSAITVNSGGTLLLGANDQINNSASMTLAGGTFAKGNFSEGAANSVGIGALTLTAAGSHIDFGTGTVGVLSFASFNPGSFTLTIDNWTGTADTVGSASTDRLIFGSDQTVNLVDFSFTGYGPGAVQFALGSGFYEVVPAIPEPSTYVAGILALALLVYHERRNIRRLVRRQVRATDKRQPCCPKEELLCNSRFLMQSKLWGGTRVMRHLPTDRRYLLAAIILAPMLLSIPPVHGTDAVETRNDVESTTLSVRRDGTLDLDLAKLYAGARVVYVSSGAIAFAGRMIDADVRSPFRFSGSDLHPTVIVELAQSQQLHRVSAAYETKAARLDVYLLNELPGHGGDLLAQKPIASIVDRADRGETAVDLAPTLARYVALRWTRNKASSEPFKVAGISALSLVPRAQNPAMLANFSKLTPPTAPPTIPSVSP